MKVALYIYTPLLFVFSHIILPIFGSLISWHNQVAGEGWDERTASAAEAPRLYETYNNKAWAQEAPVQESTPSRPRGHGVSPSFSQNPKQVLLMPEIWYVRRKILRHHRLCLAADEYLKKAPPFPAPCTFPSTVSGYSWVSFAA